jgi:hypothetical protein
MPSAMPVKMLTTAPAIVRSRFSQSRSGFQPRTRQSLAA